MSPPGLRPQLTSVTHEVRHALLQTAAGPAADVAAHTDAVACLPAFGEVACSGFPSLVGAPISLRVAAWNVQHCHFPAEAGALLAASGLDVVLLSELDIGMRRSGQRDTPRLLAQAQGHGYAFGLEFLELVSHDGLSAIDLVENAEGFHGNGLTARLPAHDFQLIHLPHEADWYCSPRRGQYRIGQRMALAVRFALGAGTVVLVSVHLESDTDAGGRGRQMRYLLDAVDLFAKGDPVLIGGDFNAGARRPDFDYGGEALFDIAAGHGYAWEGFNGPGPTSRHSLVPNAVQQDKARFDWFFGRGLVAEAASTISAVAGSTPLSDHDIIAVTIRSEGAQ